MTFSQSKFGLFGVLAFALVLASGTAAQAQTTLRYKFKQGEKLTYILETKSEMKMEVAGMNVEMTQNQTFDVSWDIKSVDKDGKAKLIQKYDRIRFSMESPMGKMEFDSKSDKEPDDDLGKQLATVFKAMAGSEFELTMDTRGQVTELKVPEKFIEAVKNVPGVAALGLSDLVSEEGMKKTINQAGLPLPQEAVTKGKTWNQKLEQKLGGIGKMSMDTTYTYEGPEGEGKKLEKIALKPKIAMEANVAGATLKVKNQETKGHALFDNAAGRLLETNTDSDMEMEINAGGMDILMKMKQKVKMKFGDKSI